MVGTKLERVVRTLEHCGVSIRPPQRHCIMFFKGFHICETHEELKVVMQLLGWHALSTPEDEKWVRYFKGGDVCQAPTIAKLPAGSFPNYSRRHITNFVKTVNRHENDTVLCCWSIAST